MLVQVCRHNGLGLDVDKILATVGFDPQCEEGIRVDVPEQFAEEADTAITCAPGGIA